MATLNWTIADSEGSLFSRGKHDNYAIIIRRIPENQPKDCIVELYVTDKKMTVSELEMNRDRRQIQPMSRSIVSASLPSTEISEAVESMKITAENRENEMTNTYP